MNFLINFPLHGKRQKNLIEWEKSGRLVPRKIQQNPSNVQNLGNWHSYFSHSMFAFFPLDLHLMVYFIICEIPGPPHQFSIAWEYAAKSIELRKPGKLVPIFSATYFNFSSIRFPSYGILYQMGRYGFFHQFLIARKMQQNPPCELPGWFSTTLLFLIVPKFGESLKEQTEKTDKVNFFFKERKFDSTYARIQSKIYQKKNRVWM